MINRKSREEIKLMRHAGHVVALVHKEMKRVIEPGISTFELDEIATRIIRENKCTPTFLGYNGFPASICASVNEQVVHGFPSKTRILKEGDIISVDVGATYRGLVGDSAWTYPVGKISDEVRDLLEITELALYNGLLNMKSGNILDDVSAAVEDTALCTASNVPEKFKGRKYGIVRQYGGHGVGRNMHEDPFLFNYRVGNKTKLKSGYVIAVEPMINLGGDEVVVSTVDNWCVSTTDNKPSAHFEHTTAVTDDGPEIMTKIEGEPFLFLGGRYSL